MATGLRRWVALVFVLLLGVAAWGFLPVRVEVTRRLPPAPEYQRLVELRGELAGLVQMYRWGRRREFLVQELKTGRSGGEPVVYGLPPEAPDSLLHRLKLAVELQLHGMGLEEPTVPIGVFVLPDSFGSHPMVLPGIRTTSSGSEYYLARGEDDPFCIIASFYPEGTEGDRPSWRPPPLVQKVVETTQMPLDPRNPPNILGLCRLLAQHGQPGAPMMNWLRRGALRFAEEPLGVDHHLRYDRGPARAPFGKLRPWHGAYYVRTLRCLAGAEDVCADLVLDLSLLPGPRAGDRGDPVGLLGDAAVDFLSGRPRLNSNLLGVGGFFFSALQVDFGPARFGEFWRSSQEPEVAFQEAFGEPMGPWIMGWLRRYVDPPSTGPGVPARATLLTVLTLGILMGCGVCLGRR